MTKDTKKSSQNNGFAYFRIAWKCLLLAFRAKRGQLFEAVFFQEIALNGHHLIPANYYRRLR